MLVLTRKPGERIRIGDGVTVTVVLVRGNTVRLGFEAPERIPVIREELDGTPSRGSPGERRRGRCSRGPSRGPGTRRRQG